MGEEIVLEGLGVAPSVLETIATIAAQEVDGVASVTSRPVGGLVGKGSARGVSVEVAEDGSLKARIHIEARYGRPLRDIATEVQRAVSDALLAQTGHGVGSVDVFIDGIVFPEQ